MVPPKNAKGRHLFWDGGLFIADLPLLSGRHPLIPDRSGIMGMTGTTSTRTDRLGRNLRNEHGVALWNRLLLLSRLKKSVMAIIVT